MKKLTSPERMVQRTIKRFSKKYDVISTDQSTVTLLEDGTFSEGQILTKKIPMVIQPLDEQSVKDLEEGQREDDARKVWCIEKLTNKDKILYENEEYTVQGMKVFSSHTEALIFKSK